MYLEKGEEAMKDNIFAIISENGKNRFDFWLDGSGIDESVSLKGATQLKIGSTENRAIHVNNEQYSLKRSTNDAEDRNSTQENER